MQVNFSSTPFKSTYKIDYNLGKGANGLRNAYGVECFCRSNAMEYEQRFNNVHENIQRDTDAVATATIISRDWQDENVEGYLVSKGIDFRKIDYAFLVGEQSILDRAVLPEYTSDCTMAYIDVEKFDKLLKKHPYGNIDYCKETYHRNFAKDTDNMIKSGDEIVVPALHINSAYLGVEDSALSYGEDGVADGTLSFYFNQTSDKPNQCLYFAMKNCGMRKVPVAVDEYSLQLGYALGIFE